MPNSCSTHEAVQVWETLVAFWASNFRNMLNVDHVCFSNVCGCLCVCVCVRMWVCVCVRSSALNVFPVLTSGATATIFQYSDRLPAACWLLLFLFLHRCCCRCCCCFCCCGASKLRRCAIELLQSMHTFTLPCPLSLAFSFSWSAAVACYHKYEILSLRSNAGGTACILSTAIPSPFTPLSLCLLHTACCLLCWPNSQGLCQQPFYGLFLGHWMQILA